MHFPIFHYISVASLFLYVDFAGIYRYAFFILLSSRCNFSVIIQLCIFHSVIFQMFFTVILQGVHFQLFSVCAFSIVIFHVVHFTSTHKVWFSKECLTKKIIDLNSKTVPQLLWTVGSYFNAYPRYQKIFFPAMAVIITSAEFVSYPYH